MEHLLLIPGPTPLPPEVVEAVSGDVINHRSEKFGKILESCVEKLKKVFQTKNDVLIMSPGGGTSGMESSIVNFFSPGDKVLIFSNGFFGERFLEIARQYKLEVVHRAFDWGDCVSESMLECIDIIHEGKLPYKGIFLVHNETSTGITNHLGEIAKIVKRLKNRNEILFVVDAVSSLGGISLPTDEWDIDVVISATQKSLMSPPGAAILSVSERAWKFYEKSSIPKYFLDLGKVKKFYEKRQTPFTPDVLTFFGLDAALKLLLQEGLENSFKRHEDVASLTREFVSQLPGAKIFGNPKALSNTVTAIQTPEGFKTKEFIQALEKQGIVIAGGQGPLAGKIFRIGHLGYINKIMIEVAFKYYIIPLYPKFLS